MGTDAFSRCHPAVNFLFFVGAIGFGAVFQHPAYLIAGAAAAVSYYLLLAGRQGLRRMLGLLPLLLVLTAVNPLLNTQGERNLFHVFGRPYTAEALLYGAAIAGTFLVMILWFGCYSAVMTGDKFTALFGNLIPALSLLLVMVLRLIPALIRKGHQIAGARQSIGRGNGGQSSRRDKLESGMAILSALASWALESGVVTADSMRARGYGSARRSCFQIYRMTARDWALLALLLGLAAVVIASAAKGAAAASFTPVLFFAPIAGRRALGLAAYGCYLLIPTVLHGKEALQWHILRSKI